MIAFVLSATFLSAQPGEAEALLRELDARIAAAKTLRIEFEVRDGSGEKGKLVSKGSLLIAERNRFRYEVRNEAEPQQFWVMVSDGKRIGAVSGSGGKPEFFPLSEWHNEVLKSWLGRGGVLVSVSRVSRVEKPGREDGPQVSNRRLLPDQEAGGVKCRVVGYDLAWRSEPLLDASVRVWIDPETKLPLRREVKFRRSPIPAGAPHTGGAREGECLTAIHTKFEIDPKLDDKLFELPSEADLLLAQMDATIAAARTLRIEFELWGEGDKPGVKGSLAIAERNRFRCELRFRDEPQRPVVVVGDGKRRGIVSGGAPEILPMPDWYTEVLKSWLGRGGTYLSLWKVERFRLQTPVGKKPGPGSGPKLSNVRLLPDESVNGVECRVVGYDLAGEKDDLPDAHGRVWIDPKTKLPVRRELDFGFGVPGARTKAKPLTAVHIKFELDPKLDDTMFELPK